MGKAIIVYGGWEGHTPRESVNVFIPLLEKKGYQITLQEFPKAYEDVEELKSADLILQCVTMSAIAGDQWKNLNEAVAQGTGFAGWHGGVIDSFRANTEYQWMTGGQWVAHPGNCIPEYSVKSVGSHSITEGIKSFTLRDTEQYYIQYDPGVEILAETVFDGGHGDTGLYPKGVRIPYAWTRQWGKGRVFVACWGHTFKDFEVDEAREIVLRGLIWATR